MKILSINLFTTKRLSKLLTDFSIGVHLKGTKKFCSKVKASKFRRTLTNVTTKRIIMKKKQKRVKASKFRRTITNVTRKRIRSFYPSEPLMKNASKKKMK